MITVNLDCLDKKLASQPNYNKVELERLLSEIISKVSQPNQHRRIETVGHTDSANKVKSTRIKAKYEKSCTRVDIRVQLMGFHEIWTIGVYLSREDQKVTKMFEQELQKATVMVVEDEKKKCIELSLSDNVDAVDRGEADAGNDVGSVNEKTAPKRRKTRKTSEALNDEVIIKIIEKFFSSEDAIKSRLAGRLYQNEFGKIIKDLDVNVFLQVAVAFLVKKTIIKICGLPRKPIIELTKNGHEFLAKHREAEKERIDALEIERRKNELLEFPSRSLKQLLRLRAMALRQSMLDENRVEQKIILSRMDEITMELKSSAEKLESLKKGERRFQGAIEKTLLKIKPESLDALILLAKTPIK